MKKLLNGQSTSFTTLPKNKDALKRLQNNNQNQTSNSIDDELTIDIGQPCGMLDITLR